MKIKKKIDNKNYSKILKFKLIKNNFLSIIEINLTQLN